jgi:transcriptional regulator of acetoin/glycerol metabolism
MRTVATAWEAFMVGEDRGLKHVRPVIRESWQRCHRLGVNPQQARLPLVLNVEDLEALQERADLVAVATPLFETVIQTWEDERFMLGITDRHGRLLYTNGHPAVLEHAQLIDAVPGSGMAEEHIGTASANVVLSQRHADYVLWSEHYCQPFHAWAAIGAPIFHPLTHEIIGVVWASGKELAHPRALDIMQRLAERLQQLLHHEELVRRVALLDTYHHFLLQHPQDIVLAIDGRGHVCGVSSSITQLLEAPQDVLGKSLLRLPGLQVEGIRHLTQHEEGQPYELRVVAAHARGLALPATAIPIRQEQQPVGTLIVLTPPIAPRQGKAYAPTPWRATYAFSDLIGNAPTFRDSLAIARQAARSDFPVLLLGESGTGKELLAHAIHGASLRRRGPFVPVNCGATSDELLAVELFGYVEGAFTGAVRGGRRGKLEIAHGGSLFLDEVEAMSPKMQVSLLRVLEEERVIRVGGEHPISVNMRVIAASNEDLAVAVREKRFRLDLYHRLSAFLVTVPPLRERQDDLPLLVRFFLDRLGFPHLQLTPEALSLLHRYAWPGNVRELKNVLMRAAAKAQGTAIHGRDFPREIREVEMGRRCLSVGSLRDTEREMIVRALASARGDIITAASCLGIHRATLYRKLKKYGLSSAGENRQPSATASA